MPVCYHWGDTTIITATTSIKKTYISVYQSGSRRSIKPQIIHFIPENSSIAWAKSFKSAIWSVSSFISIPR